MHNCCYLFRWTVLPEMFTRSQCQSALIIGTGDDDGDAAILVVGGWGGTGKEAALLVNRPHQTRGEQGYRGGQWRWRQLSPMQKSRGNRPGLLLFGSGRVLVCGGSRLLFGGRTAEILQLPRGDNEKGVWTVLTQEFTQYFSINYLVQFYDRIVAVGESLITLVTPRSKQHLFNIICLHLRTSRGVRRVDINLLFHPPGKNTFTNRSLRVLISNASHFFCFSGCPTGDLRVEAPPKYTVRWVY